MGNGDRDVRERVFWKSKLCCPRRLPIRGAGRERKGNTLCRSRSRLQVFGQPPFRLLFVSLEKVATFEGRQQSGRPAIFDEYRQGEVRPLAGGGPCRRLTFPTRIGRGEVGLAYDAKDMVSAVVTLLHPSGDVAAGGNLPFMDMRGMAELLQLLSDPERPVAVDPRIADEDVRQLPDSTWTTQIAISGKLERNPIILYRAHNHRI